MGKCLLYILLFLSPFLANAQQNDSQLAFTYYQNKEYEKAADCFLRLYERTRSKSYLDYHIISLINGKQYEKAEMMLKRFMKEDDSNKEHLIHLGFVYEQQGKINKADDCFERAVKKLIPHANDIHSLANSFRSIAKYDWAIKTYERGRILLKRPDDFMSELGDCYMMERNYERMCDLFMRSLELKPGGIQNVTAQLAYARKFDVGSNVDTLIAVRLNQIIHQKEYPPVFDELAVWFALQRNNYHIAFEHAVRLNRKQPNKINIYINIAREASGGKRYAVALEAYNKVLALGQTDNPFYSTARKEILTCKYAACETQSPKCEHYSTIAAECGNFMKEFGYINSHVDVIMLLSDIYAYRLNLLDSANSVLLRGESIPRLDNQTLAKIKSKRADLVAFMDNVWEATILYTQIEKANPNNDTGYEAKLKKAWMAYYEGDLLWARAQFDVLKGATSKLISNDAIQMSHFISTNYEEDEDNSGLETIAKTEYLLYRQQYTDAKKALDSLMSNAPSGIAERAALLKARLFRRERQYDKATDILVKLQNTSEQTSTRAEAIFELANLKIETGKPEEAVALYKILVSEYSGSVYSVEAGRLYREMQKGAAPIA